MGCEWRRLLVLRFLTKTIDRCSSNFHPLPHAIAALQDYSSNTNGILNQSRLAINSSKDAKSGYGSSFITLYTYINDRYLRDIKDWEARLMEEEHSETSALPQLQTGKLIIKDLLHTILTYPPTLIFIIDGLPILSHTSDEPLLYKKPDTPLHFTCITIGTRGDVQPYIALCKGLMADGHKCRIATHDEFKDWIEEHSIEFRSIGGDPSELMVIGFSSLFNFDAGYL